MKLGWHVYVRQGNDVFGIPVLYKRTRRAAERSAWRLNQAFEQIAVAQGRYSDRVVAFISHRSRTRP